MPTTLADEVRGLSFHFDAMPTIVVPGDRAGVFVGDALGRVHVLDVPPMHSH